MKSAGFLITLTLVMHSFQPCFAYDEPFIMGHGRYLSASEQQAFFDLLNQSPLTDETRRYSEAYRTHLDHLDNKDQIDVLQFLQFTAAVSSELYNHARPAYELFMICFGCEEGIPIKNWVQRETQPAPFYAIWVLSGEFILLEKHPHSGAWRVLYSGGAE